MPLMNNNHRNESMDNWYGGHQCVCADCAVKRGDIDAMKQNRIFLLEQTKPDVWLNALNSYYQACLTDDDIGGMDGFPQVTDRQVEKKMSWEEPECAEPILEYTIQEICDAISEINDKLTDDILCGLTMEKDSSGINIMFLGDIIWWSLTDNDKDLINTLVAVLEQAMMDTLSDINKCFNSFVVGK